MEKLKPWQVENTRAVTKGLETLINKLRGTHGYFVITEEKIAPITTPITIQLHTGKRLPVLLTYMTFPYRKGDSHTQIQAKLTILPSIDYKDPPIASRKWYLTPLAFDTPNEHTFITSDLNVDDSWQSNGLGWAFLAQQDLAIYHLKQQFAGMHPSRTIAQIRDDSQSQNHDRKQWTSAMTKRLLGYVYRGLDETGKPVFEKIYR